MNLSVSWTSFRLSVFAAHGTELADVNLVFSELTAMFSHWSLVTGHWSLVTGHWSLVTGHWSLVTGHGRAVDAGIFISRRETAQSTSWSALLLCLPCSR